MPSINEKPYLVQRITVRPEPVEGFIGVDRCFDFDYMGSAEFEFGALPKALKRMKALTAPAIRYLKLGTKEVAWFVGSEDEVSTAQAFFKDQLGECKWQLQEWTAIKPSYGKDPHGLGSTLIFDGWWAIDMTWCLFKQQQHAELWLKCLKEK